MVTDNEVIWRLFLAAVLGGVIGLEREMHGRAAGFRTHILVCAGAALIMLTSIYICGIYRGVAAADPGRIAAGVVTGIGFLGAGTIMRFRASVAGLTTAASLWIAAGIGLAAGCGFYQGAYTTTAIVLIALFFLTRLERSWMRKDWYRTILVEGKGDAEQLEHVKSVLSNYRAEVRDFEVRKSEREGNVMLELNLKLLATRDTDRIISEIMQIDGVERAKWV